MCRGGEYRFTRSCTPKVRAREAPSKHRSFNHKARWGEEGRLLSDVSKPARGGISLYKPTSARRLHISCNNQVVMKFLILSLVSVVAGLAVLGAAMPFEESNPDTWFNVAAARGRRDTASRDRPPLDPNTHLGNSSVCVNMSPVHGNHLPQTGESPYTMTVDKVAVSPGDIVTLTVTGSQPFKGVYCQGREPGTEIPVGEFQPHKNPSVAVQDCPPNTDNALLQVGREDLNNLTMDWKAPAGSPKVFFRCTFVKDFKTFWVRQKSPQDVHIA